MCVETKKKYSLVYVFQFAPDRYCNLFESIDSFPKTDDVEVCILETGRQRYVYCPPGCSYKFLRTDTEFNRGMSFNNAVEFLASGEILILSDADIIYPSNYLELLEQVNLPAIGWKKMKKLTDRETRYYKTTKELPESCVVEVESHISGAAGGVTVVEKDVFLKVGGFKHTFFEWGKEDNLFWDNYISLTGNTRVSTVLATIYHLYHKSGVNNGI